MVAPTARDMANERFGVLIVDKVPLIFDAVPKLARLK
jgi:hypothetical protein